MRAMILRQPGKYSSNASLLEVTDVAAPSAGDGELLVRVSVCAVCRTDLDVVEGRVVAPRYPVVPGHQVVGRVAGIGRGVTGFREGDRVGVAWINSADGTCRWCRAGTENLCPQFRSTGCDVDGGYAEYLVVPAAFAHAIPNELTDTEAAPLLCAGAIGWRSLRLTRLSDGERLGLSGFGSSAHLVLQMARLRYPASPIYVFARDEGERGFAMELGAMWAGNFTDVQPELLDAVIDTTPVWKPMVELLPKLAPGGRFVINAIRKSSTDQSELLRLDYATHLWMEREIKSVANVTREDVRQLLALAVETGLRPTVEVLPLERANEALARLSSGARMRGAMVLSVSQSAAQTTTSSLQ
ncbi:MAG: alcohol dehydrogenase [Gemmatimonadetes bacterium]|nr:MAG: alcohol dehydrogenase [Gemmatimonadota bacterium]